MPVLVVGGLLAFIETGHAGSLLFIGGTAAPVESPVNAVTSIQWVLDDTAITSVKSALVAFDGPLDKYSIVCLQATDGADPLANGCNIPSDDWNVGDAPIPIAFGDGIPPAFGPELGETAPAASLINGVNVTVVGLVTPTVNSTAPVKVIDIEWVLLGSDTSLVQQVKIEFEPYSGNNSDGFQVFLALRDSDLNVLAQHAHETLLVLDPADLNFVNPPVIVWDLSQTPVPAELITRFELGIKPTDAWERLANVPDKLGHSAGMATDGTDIYLLIGSRNRLFRFDPSTGSWTRLANAPNNPNQGGALVYAEYGTKGYLYAFRGGSRDFWRYDIATNSWTSRASAPGDVRWGGSLTWDGGDFIYAFRGGDRTDFWRYSIPTNTWTSLADAPNDVKEGGALVFVNDGGNGGVYAMRGGGTVDFWRHDVASEGWENLADLPFTIGRGGAVASDGADLIYALRGNDTKEIYRYVISLDEWAIGPDIPEQMREGGTLTFLNGDVYATQGRQQDEFLKISPLPPFYATDP